MSYTIDKPRERKTKPNFKNVLARVTAVPKPIKLTKEEKLKARIQSLKTKHKEKIRTAKQQPISTLKKAVQRQINAYIRRRDIDLPCISCQKPVVWEKSDAGHFIAQGSSGALRFDLDNIHKQCDGCNRYKHGNLLEYRIHLVKKIGLENVEYLEAHRHDMKKWTREELELLRKVVKDLHRELELSENPIGRGI